MSEFHFDLTDYDVTVLKEKEIRKLAQQIREMIEEYGIEQFQNDIVAALEKHRTYYPTCWTKSVEAMECDSTNK